MGETTRARTRIIVIALIAVMLIVAVVLVMQALRPSSDVASTPVPTPTATPTATHTPTPTPTPTPTDAPADPAAYDVSALPRVDVFAVVPALPVDDKPTAAFLGVSARALAEAIPVFTAPSTAPVAALARDQQFDGTTVPIIEREANWLKVLLPGRQARPSQGNPAQVTGWVRAADVEVSPNDTTVEVGITARTIDIVRGGVVERIATDFAWGAAETPTPLGRTFLMTTAVVPEYGYTRGNPISYLSVQSPTLDGFGGADVAVTAFHYHDARSGSISNGCIRVDAQVAQTLAALPHGTPVTVHP